MTDHLVVDPQSWLDARRSLLAREEALMRLKKEVNEARMGLPWVKLETTYVFDTPAGRRSLGDLFDGRSQLLVYHFMFNPDWAAGCPGCSFMADTFDGALAHLRNHDVALVAASRAPLAKLEAYKARMGWRFPWVSSQHNTFSYDFGVSFRPEEVATGKVAYNYGLIDAEEGEDLPGLSVFHRDPDGEVFHTYSAYGPTLEDLISALAFLDRTPKGRNETSPLSFIRRHDEYENAPAASACCSEIAAA
ncbi:MAG TPA: thioredoxin family protein [Caulobacteraceae bacterium]